MKLDKKQRVMLVLTIIALLFLAWQIIDLIRGDVSSSPAPAAQTTTQQAAASNTPEPKPASVKSTANQANPVRTQIASQRKEYLQMADQFELAKMQSQLLKQELDIAKTKQQISQTNQSISGITNAGGVTGATDTNAKLHLVYVGQVSGKWSATVSQGGQYTTVSVGSVLPNGSVVSSVNQQGITYRLGGKTLLLGFNGQTVVATNPALSSVHQIAQSTAAHLREMSASNNADNSSLRKTLTTIKAKQQRKNKLKGLSSSSVKDLQQEKKL